MQHLFVPYPIAKELKELGFNEACIAGFNDKGRFIMYPHESIWINDNLEPEEVVATPLYQQVIDWFLEKYDIYIFDIYTRGKKFGAMVDLADQNKFINYNQEKYTALTAAIEQAIKIVKNQKK